ncbi:3-hydroxyacyl-ACP dehydratase FabZ [Salinarimonas sp.]|uniref:3-hydroxyacyl-ACP dehydratase FabZ n=1 Tax=Salinarimonas sp. TaxID=2766526 RepID=UPI0032D92B5C
MPDTHLDIQDIMRRLPHRPPFLMIDRIVSWGPKQVVAHKNVTMNEPYFAGHFPAAPIVPGVLLGESMAQASAFIEPETDAAEGGAADRPLEGIGDKAFLTGMTLKLHRAAVPGDQLVVTVVLLKRLGVMSRFKGQIHVDRREIATADFSVALAAD